MLHFTHQLVQLFFKLITNPKRFWLPGFLISLSGLIVLTAIEPAIAHHAIGGNTPANWVEGLLSGLAHPIIGLDHLAFVIAMGVVGAITQSGLVTPIAFLLAAMAGTGLHLASVDLPVPEVVIAASVITFGILLVKRISLEPPILAALVATAGLFHGYAYGESIIGAKMTALFAYLVGFTLIQGVIAGGAMKLMEILSTRSAPKIPTVVKVFGYLISTIGVVFLSQALIG